MSTATTPQLDASEAARIALEFFGLRAKVAPLPSERDQNFLLDAGAGRRFVLKIAKADEDRAVLELQNAALRQVADRAPDLAVPRVWPTLQGDELVRIEVPPGRAHFIRLIGWLDGEMLVDAQPHDEALLDSLGTTMAELDLALRGFSHPAMHRDLHWNLKRADLALEHLKLLGSEQQKVVQGAMDLWSRIEWGKLRHGVIHGDANDHNVLVRGGRVVGLIDFGDLVHSALACDPAIAMTYALLDKPNPSEAGSTIVRAYHARLPLEPAEVDALYALICARLCMSICYAAYNARIKSGDAYQQVTAAPAWRLLQDMRGLSAQAVGAAWRRACGM